MMMGTFFEVGDTYARLDERDRLLRLNQWISWESLRQVLGEITFVRSSRGGRPAWDPLLIAKCLILQSCYQLSDEELEYQINDRLSFKRFLGLDVAAKAPDAKTIWLYRERMKEAGLERKIFEWFSNVLDQNGVVAQKGQIVDATFVPTHKPTGKHKKQEDAGIPLSAAQKAQIDPDATFTKKGATQHHGYKNHTQIDNKNKIIRQYEVTTASVHDSQVFEQILDKPTQAKSNTGRDVYADSAYRSAKSEKTLKNNHLKSKIHHRAYRNKPLTDHQDRVNHTRSKTRSRIEHVFGHMNTSMGGLVIHTIGLARAKVKIGLKNLTYNMQRFAFLMTQNQSPRPRRLPA